MLFNVPQYIDVEDKIAGPLTAKHLLWMFAMGGVLLILWTILEKTYFIVCAIPVVIIFLALAFYRPYNQPFIKFIFSGFVFLLRPKIYSWQRMPKMKNEDDQHKKAQNQPVQKKEKKVTAEEIKELAKIIDSGGMVRVERPVPVADAQEENQGRPASAIQKMFRKKLPAIQAAEKEEKTPFVKKFSSIVKRRQAVQTLQASRPPEQKNKQTENETEAEGKIIFFN